MQTGMGRYRLYRALEDLLRRISEGLDIKKAPIASRLF